MQYLTALPPTTWEGTSQYNWVRDRAEKYSSDDVGSAIIHCSSLFCELFWVLTDIYRFSMANTITLLITSLGGTAIHKTYKWHSSDRILAIWQYIKNFRGPKPILMEFCYFFCKLNMHGYVYQGGPEVGHKMPPPPSCNKMLQFLWKVAKFYKDWLQTT